MNHVFNKLLSYTHIHTYIHTYIVLYILRVGVMLEDMEELFRVVSLSYIHTYIQYILLVSTYRHTYIQIVKWVSFLLYVQCECTHI